ncbi:MAG: Loki-CTERM sorting domain-containing protein [Promethearchaeota archaeon]
MPGYNVEFILLTLALSLTIFLIFRKKKVS